MKCPQCPIPAGICCPVEQPPYHKRWCELVAEKAGRVADVLMEMATGAPQPIPREHKPRIRLGEKQKR